MSARPAADDRFRLSGPLPRGTVVLEASAGTGKTFTIAALISRWVAEEGLRLPSLLAVTFTRAATAELRERVRRRLVETLDHLEVAAAVGRAPATGDEVLDHLAGAPRDVLSRRVDRLRRALADIDAATISTIHGFCQHVLDSLGLAADLDREAELVEDRGELVDEVVGDLMVRLYHDGVDRPRPSRADVVALCRRAVDNPAAGLAPREVDADTMTAVRRYLADAVRAEVDRRSRRRRLLAYDDLLTRLDQALTDPLRAVATRRELRRRYQIVLIDEFQDTDPVQWNIVRRAFTAGDDAADDGRRALVLIGDPKQAIYAFRGADVYAYLQAVHDAEQRPTLTTNWRSDAPLLRGLEALFRGAEFGDPAIAFHPVAAAPGHDDARLAGAPASAPVRLRLLPRHDGLPRTRSGALRADIAREVIADDVAADVVDLLGARPHLVDRDRVGRETDRRPLEPRHVAVLVRTNAQATLVHEALRLREVPAVINGVASVFATPAAQAWARLLDALERPAWPSAVRSLATTLWVGWNAERIDRAGDRDWEALHQQAHDWAITLRDRGVAAVQRDVSRAHALLPRLLAQTGGQRLVADLDHIGELLHTVAATERLGAAALADWLRERMAEAAREATDERLRRLETDDDAVQILTVHRSKGLEFPIVYCPFLWSSSRPDEDVALFHDPDTGERLLDVGGGHPDAEVNLGHAARELHGEELRLLYVALTRARHQVVVHHATAGLPEWSGLNRLLLNRRADGVDTTRAASVVDDEVVRDAAGRIAAAAAGAIDVEEVPPAPSERPWMRRRTSPPRLGVARFDRTLDTSWRRTSYSALTRLETSERLVRDEPDERVADDEALADTPAPVPTVTGAADDPDAGAAADYGAGADAGGPDVEHRARLAAGALPLGALPGGVEFGTLVHTVLEDAEFTAAPLEDHLREIVVARLDRWRLVDAIDVEALTAGLAAALRTPLGPATGDLRLDEVTRRDRRDEVAFELPLDRADGAGPARVGALLDLLTEHLDDDDPLVDYPAAVPREIRDRDLRGYLNGSIDLVLRRPVDGTDRYAVVDYKTNLLAPWGAAPTAWHYRPAALAQAMTHGHYPLQALLYVVALHRYLRWRLPDYDPARHLDGARYLFVRGMSGPDVPRVDGQPCGVFTWDVPPALVEAASALLHGQSSS